uniref:Uncharacterized protein n=1 Tax=Anopheles maculatus TaxID=74869 RepID=A0A182SK75_9DIPT
MEASHKRIIHDLEEKHQQEIAKLILEKEQALAEETQATLAALDAMKKAHQNEVQREVTRFKQEFLKQFQKGGQPPQTYREKEQELEDVRQEILSLSEKYSMKCVETAALEEKLRNATQQLKCSQQHIQQLDVRNKQLRAHFVSNQPEETTSAPPASSAVTPKDTNLFTSSTQSESSPRAITAKRTPTVGTGNGSPSTTAMTMTVPASASIEPGSPLELLELRECQHLLNNKKESHPRLKFTEGSPVFVFFFDTPFTLLISLLYSDFTILFVSLSYTFNCVLYQILLFYRLCFLLLFHTVTLCYRGFICFLFI